jgi:hypothetical protein
MILVNFIGDYREIGAIWKHHRTYCSYADTIMPQFFFAVGFALRLTYLKRLETIGWWGATRAVIGRCAGLLLLGLIVHGLDGKVASWAELEALGVRGALAQAFRREYFQTLVQIALATLWVLPVIARGPGVRAAYLVGSAVLYQGLSHWFYFDLAWNTPVIDGGWLGVIAWSIPLLAGTLAYDAVARQAEGTNPLPALALGAILLMAAGYLISSLGNWPAPPPFVMPPATAKVTPWTMSQRTASVSYLTFAAGFSVAAYALFVVLTDWCGLRIGVFRTFGQNALAAYLLHPMVASVVSRYCPSDSPLWYVLAAFTVYFGLCYLFIRYLEKNGIFLRL